MVRPSPSRPADKSASFSGNKKYDALPNKFGLRASFPLLSQ